MNQESFLESIKNIKGMSKEIAWEDTTGTADRQDAVWKSSENKIKILNPHDFVIPDFVNILSKEYGFDKRLLGLTNAGEIKSRLEVMRVLMNQDTRNKIGEFSEFFNQHSSLPSSENEFLNQYQDKKNVYWIGAKKLLEFLKPYQNVESIKTISETVTNSLHLEEKEDALTKSILERLSKVAFLEGVIKMKFNRGQSYNNGSLSNVA